MHVHNWDGSAGGRKRAWGMGPHDPVIIPTFVRVLDSGAFAVYYASPLSIPRSSIVHLLAYAVQILRYRK